jgi:hypothetical protein
MNKVFDFLPSYLPEPKTQVRGIEVWHWDNPDDAEVLLRKYFPDLYKQLPPVNKVDFEV